MNTELASQSPSTSNALHWQVSGQGPDLVLVHGWGMNGAVWQQTVASLEPHFRVHVVDLPGFGLSAHAHGESLENIAAQVLRNAPEIAVWVGWSLGGLVASQIALTQPHRVSKLITVASSPKFAAERPWRGIKPEVLTNFTAQLLEDFSLTIERFMALQAMGSPSAKQDIKLIKQAVLSRPSPNPDSLLVGLKLLADIDLRESMISLTQPLLRLYGRLDGLVPAKVASDLDKQWPNSEQHIFTQSSHAPFVTEHDAFCEKVITFGLDMPKVD